MTLVAKRNVLGLLAYKPQETRTSFQEALGILEDWVSAAVGLSARLELGGVVFFIESVWDTRNLEIV